MEMTVDEVLMEFNDSSPDCMPCSGTNCDNCREMNKAITQAKLALKEMVESKKIQTTMMKKDNCKRAFNQAISEIAKLFI